MRGNPVRWRRKVLGLTLAGLSAAILTTGVAAALPFDPFGIVPWQATPAPKGADPLCTQDYNYSAPTDKGPAITWGIGPQLAGDVGTSQATPVPENASKRDAALRELKPPHAPFTVRLNRMFESAGAAGIAQFKGLAKHYASLGIDVMIQVRYHPAAAENGDMKAWVAYVKQVVDAFGPMRRVTALQITNEANLGISSNTSDGAYKNADQAVVQGVIAAHREAARRHFKQLSIGFNYAAIDPTVDAPFFTKLGQLGGAPFRRAVNWVGMDFYPGSDFPPAYVNGKDVMIEWLSSLRRCLMPKAGLGAKVPIRMTEIGYPTSAGHTDAEQLSAVKDFVTALNEYRGVYNVTNVNWFDLRDNNTADTTSTSNLGLLNSNYSPKPAFAEYRRLVRADSAHGGVARR